MGMTEIVVIFCLVSNLEALKDFSINVLLQVHNGSTIKSIKINTN
jgi:hypothetical protein